VAFAQSPPDQGSQAQVEKEIAVVELGAAGGHSLTDHATNYGLNFAAEVTPIENWLELEAGVTPLFARTSHEVDADFLFKKPWTVSRSFEFMLGAGPEWVRTTRQNITTNALAGEGVLDLMFWPKGGHRYGWYLEPSYDYSFAAGHEKSIGITGGFLIAIR
jgi:hypothetical protein